MSDYGRAGLVGIMPPQSNTTVEAELGVLLPPEVATVVSRLVCDEDDSRARLVGYFRNVHVSRRAFDTLNPDVTLFACTGSTYLVGLEAEDRVLRDEKVVSAARAVLAALEALEVRRIALLSPYPAWLTQACVGFWRAQGTELVDVHRLEGERTDTRQIYRLGSREALQGLRQLKLQGAQAVLITGTGMPSLGAIVRASLGIPVLSSNLCLAWAAMQRLSGDPIDAWLSSNATWRDRLAARFPSVLENQ